MYLRQPQNATDCSRADVDDRIRHLEDLHAAAARTLEVRQLISLCSHDSATTELSSHHLHAVHMQDRNNRQEALTWAIDHVAKLPPSSTQHWRRVLCGPLAKADADSSSPAVTAYALELLCMFCEHEPATATAVLWRYRPEVGSAACALGVDRSRLKMLHGNAAALAADNLCCTSSTGV